MPLIEDLLNENRYWTFNASNWEEFSSNGIKQRYNIFWGGKTKWNKVIAEVRKKMGKVHGEEIYYERQVVLKKPDISFE